MDAAKAAVRAAIMTWRDEQSLAAIRLAHEAAAAGMAALEADIAAVPVAQAMLTPADHATRIVRAATREAFAATLDLFFRRGAAALRRIDAECEAAALAFHHRAHRPILPRDEAVSPPGWLARGLSVPVEALGWIADAALPPVVRARTRDWSDGVASVAGSLSGAHEMLRAAGRNELGRTWLGSVGTDADGSFLQSVLDRVDAAALAAKEMFS